MSSSTMRDKANQVRETATPFAATAGVCRPVVHEDPFAVWAELMELVEALCPDWPERPPTRGENFRI